MTEHCPDHSKLVQTVGEIAGKQVIMLRMLENIQKDIASLFDLVNANKTITAVQETKFAPALWVLTVVASLLIGAGIHKGVFGG